MSGDDLLKILESILNCYSQICLSFRNEAKESAVANSTTVYTTTENALAA